jgi:hypothetical protein
VNVLVLGVNLGGNIGDVYILQSTVTWLLEIGAKRVVLVPMRDRLNSPFALRALESLGTTVLLARKPTNGSLWGRIASFIAPHRYDRASDFAGYQVVACGGQHRAHIFFRQVESRLRDCRLRSEPLLYGPFSFIDDVGEEFVSRCLGRLTHFAVREPETAMHLKGLGLENFSVVPDITFAQFQPKPFRSGRGTFGLCIRGAISQAFVRNFVVGAQRHNREVVLLSTHVVNDLSLILALRSEMPHLRIEAPMSPLEYMDLAATMDLVVSARLHGLIMATNGGSLTLPICATRKMRIYASFMRSPLSFTGLENADQIDEKLTVALENGAELFQQQQSWFGEAKGAVGQYLESRRSEILSLR